MGAHGVGHVPAVERGDVGRVDGVQQVSRGEDARMTGTQGRIDQRPAGAGIHDQSSGTRELVVGHPVTRQDERVALDDATRTGVDVLELDGPQRRLADDADHPGAGGHLHPQQWRSGNHVEHRIGLGRAVGGGHHRGVAAGVLERQNG